MPSRQPQDTPSHIPWPPLLFATAFVLGWLMGRLRPVAWPGLDDTPARALGYSFGVLGLGLAAWAFVTLVRARANILPHRAASRLVTAGPYRIWRHPLYMSEVLLLLGFAQLTYNIWYAIAGFLFAIAVRALAIGPEERHLEARFGAEYESYQARTRRWF